VVTAYYVKKLCIRLFALCGQGSSLDPSAQNFISIQCTRPGREELVGVCGVCARCVGQRKEQ